MKRYFVIAGLILFSISLFGCGKKKESLEDMQVPMSMETLSTINTEKAPAAEPQAATPAKAQVAESAVAPAAAAKLEPLPPQGPYKPTVQEIQTALKNAGFYAGTVDGKLGPKTKKAIEDFQKANNLVADGKVGPKTWAALGTHLNAPAPVTPEKNKR